MSFHVKAEATPVVVVTVAVAATLTLMAAGAAVVSPLHPRNVKLNQFLTMIATSGNTTNTRTTPIKIQNVLRPLGSVNSHPDVHLANPADSRSKSKIFHTSS